jgi:hypothetical protein
MAPAGWAAQVTRVVRPAGPHRPCTRGEADWATPWIQPKYRFLNKKFFSFLTLFYKLQINLNSNQN